MDDIYIYDTGNSSDNITLFFYILGIMKCNNRCLATLIWFSPAVKGQIPQARYAHSTNFAPGGRLIVFGGCGENSVFQEIFILDLGTCCWHSIK